MSELTSSVRFENVPQVGQRVAAPPGEAPRGEGTAARNLGIGQVAEWLVWAHLVASSGADLHVFLPLRDRGIDCIVHRISTDSYARGQVKGLHRQPDGGFLVQVMPGELADDGAVVLIVETELGSGSVALGPHALLVGAPEYKALARRRQTRVRLEYDAHVRLPPPPTSPWARFSTPMPELGERLLPSAAAAKRLLAPVLARPAWAARPDLGYRAEMELLRRAADTDRLNVFKAFPDLEPNEYVVYDVETRELAGVQVKAVSLAPGMPSGHAYVYRPSLRPSSKTWFVILLADSGEPGFLETCAVIPADTVHRYLLGEGPRASLSITRNVTGRLAPWRVPLADLGGRLVEVASGG